MFGASLLVAVVVVQSVEPDFQYFRDEIEPIFLAKRDGHARCVACHQHRAQFHLQPLSDGASSWSEEQSRRNYASALRLIRPGEPLSSRLLTMPLAEAAGGNPFHPGGKHWETREDPTFRKLSDWVLARPARDDTIRGLDFDFFRARVEPILAKKRDGHARCVACHQHRAQFHLQPLEDDGASTWSEASSRRNYASAARLVAPGAPDESRLLLMPLSEGAGGAPFHPGGKHWESKDDEDYQVLAEWVRGARPGAR